MSRVKRESRLKEQRLESSLPQPLLACRGPPARWSPWSAIPFLSSSGVRWPTLSHRPDRPSLEKNCGSGHAEPSPHAPLAVVCDCGVPVYTAGRREAVWRVIGWIQDSVSHGFNFPFRILHQQSSSGLSRCDDRGGIRRFVNYRQKVPAPLAKLAATREGLRASPGLRVTRGCDHSAMALRRGDHAEWRLLSCQEISSRSTIGRNVTRVPMDPPDRNSKVSLSVFQLLRSNAFLAFCPCVKMRSR